MNISLPETLKSFVDAQTVESGYGSCSEYIRALIRQDQDRMHLRGLLLAGAASEKGKQPVDKAYFADLRRRARKRRR